jgi:hypothetical protein
MPLDKRTIAVMRFVIEPIDGLGKRPSWNELFELWNREHPEWRHAERPGLYKAYEWTAREIAAPGASALCVSNPNNMRDIPLRMPTYSNITENHDVTGSSPSPATSNAFRFF